MQISATDVIHAFRKDEPYLFIGAASVTVGLVVVGFLLMRRRFDRLLSFFAWFAILYGERLWLTSSVLRLMESPSLLRARFGAALNFFVAVPAFLFFQETGLLGRSGRVIAYTVCLLEMALIAAIFAGVPLGLLYNMNSGLVIAGSLPLVFLAFRQRDAGRDVVVFRAGLLIFVVFVLWANTRDLLGYTTYTTNVEPYGFGLFLCCLGYVAGKRALDRDQQLAVAAPGTRGGKAHSAFHSARQLPRVGALYRGRALCADDCSGRRLLRISPDQRPYGWVVGCGCLGAWGTGGADRLDGEDGDQRTAATCSES